MVRILIRPLGALALVLLVGGLTGCDTLGDVFGGDQEVSGTVEEVGADFLTVDANRYTVNADTKFEGYAGLSDIAVGDEVEIEYEDRSGERVALEIDDPATADHTGERGN